MGLVSSVTGAPGKIGGFGLRLIKFPISAFKKIFSIISKVMQSVGLGGVAEKIGIISDRDMTGNYTGDSNGILSLVGKLVSVPVKIPTVAVGKASNSISDLKKKLLDKI